MGWLAGALVALFGELIGWLGKVVVKKLVILAAVTALVGTLIYTFHSLLSGFLNTVATNTSVPAALQAGIGWLPANVPTVLSVVVAVEIGLWTFRLARRVAEYRLAT